MEQKNNSDQVLNTVRSIVYHLNDVNWVKMTQKMMALPINNVKLLDDITNIIFDRALKRQNYTHIYAQMCARLINDSKFNNLIATDTEITFQKVLLKKCHDVFYSNYQEELNKIKDTMKNDNMVPKKCLSVVLNNFLFDFQKRSICNCRFIGVLFKNGAFPEKYILKCIGDLGKDKNDNNYELQMHCLCIILQSVGLILSKTSYDLNKKINKLVSSMENHGMSSTLKCLIKKLKIMNSKDPKSDLSITINTATEIYTLKKPFLIKYCENKKLKSTGTTSELRARLSRYLKGTISLDDIDNTLSKEECDLILIKAKTNKIDLIN
ncbi:unnamed protein product [Macrosiphum euphorbiae]|uniref:MIF4G domain-containing protein n=1 Tax=Macrosiphum euphorbiae TaxID=13131 RepID=A0AAV0VRF0_9HEMI|nr:unnamed protein product [Macrosiphum euphorbiae]